MASRYVRIVQNGSGGGGTERLSIIKKDKDCPAADSNSSGTSIAERKRQAQREQSVAARKLAEQNGWCRCPKCKQMVVREVSSRGIFYVNVKTWVQHTQNNCTW